MAAVSVDHRIDGLKAPLLVSWQITRDCDLCCLHCCTESAPGKPLPDELSASEAIEIAHDIARSEVPYAMLCGGEPLTVPYFFELAETLGQAGVQLKLETNGQLFDESVAERLARLPIRSVQISLDGDSQEIYARQRPGGSLEKAHAACRAVRAAGLNLEITFAPTRINIHQTEAVIERALMLGAFRFNSGKLMRIGTAARLWQRLEPSAEQYRSFRSTLERLAENVGEEMELCYAPFSIGESLSGHLEDPPATMLVLPNGRVKVSAALPYLCADLRRQTIHEAWNAYRAAWRDDLVTGAILAASSDETRHSKANNWKTLPVLQS
ncbi:MAG TPA: radical SAM protein [Gammaproteobacteria bacterium]|nr:radical SAM protein [Gammaproteobacteria bacterium]